jgi:MFS family permease
MPIIALVCVLTFLHYVGVQMRGPVLSLYAAEHGATPTGVGLIVGAHMMAAAIGSIPLGRASDIWGRRPLMLAAMALSVVTSLLLPLFEGEYALIAIYGLAGLAVAAFTPSALSLVGDAAPAGRVGHAYAWYSTAHYGAIGIGPFLGGVLAERWGYRTAFVVAAGGIVLALAIGHRMLGSSSTRATAPSTATFTDIEGDANIWAGWIVSASGLLVQGVVFPFFPLLANAQGLGPATIGVAFLVLGLANTAARLPAGWLIDRTGRSSLYAVGGVVGASLATALLPHVRGQATLLVLMGVFGVASGLAFVAISVGLTASSAPAVRGLVMGGYSTSLYLGFAVGSFALGPVITRHGYSAGFTLGAAAGVVGALVAGLLWARAGLRCPERSVA